MHNNPVPVSIGIIPSVIPGHVLLIERADGGLALPGGYIEEMEDAAQALTREVQEETGLVLDSGGWQLFFSAVTPTNKLLLFSYYAVPVAAPVAFQPNHEVLQVLSAAWDTPLKFALHELALGNWKRVLPVAA